MNTINTHSLSKRYGKRRGIENLDLEVEGGTLFGFLGPNGSGKTTTIRLLLGFLRANGGTARMLDLDCWRDSRRLKREVGYIPGDLRLYSWMTTRNALSFVGKTRGLNLQKPGFELAERLQLDVSVPVRKMSRGTRQKLGLVLALAHDPKLLILDEPTTALDPPMQHALYAELRERAKRGTTVFFSSHTLSEVDELCDRVGILREGRIVVNAGIETLREQAERIVILRWRDETTAASTEAPPFLNLEKRLNSEWECTLQHSARELVQWAATQPIEDITIGKPDLDRLFRSFYSAKEQES